MHPGNEISCEVENIKRGEIVVDKATNPRHDDTAFDFSWGSDGDASGAFSLRDDDPAFSTGPLDPGGYTVAEAERDGWTLSSLECVDEATGEAAVASYDGAEAAIDLAAGQVVVCTFANEREQEQEPPVVTTPPTEPTPFSPPEPAAAPPAAPGQALAATGGDASPAAAAVAIGMLLLGAGLIGGTRFARRGGERL